MSTKVIGVKQIAGSTKIIQQDIQNGYMYIVVKNSQPVWRIIPYDIDIDEILENYEMQNSKHLKKRLKKSAEQYKKGQYKTLEEIEQLAA